MSISEIITLFWVLPSLIFCLLFFRLLSWVDGKETGEIDYNSFFYFCIIFWPLGIFLCALVCALGLLIVIGEKIPWHKKIF